MKNKDFITGKVPITKEEVRAISLNKLELLNAKTFIDVGAGTGSVSIEAGYSYPNLKVIAIERNDDAIDYMYGKGGTVTITGSVLTTTAKYDAGLRCSLEEGLITINIKNSTINAPEKAIQVEEGEKIKYIKANDEKDEASYVTKEIKIGELWGNAFDLTLREVDQEESVIHQAIEQMKEKGYEVWNMS